MYIVQGGLVDCRVYNINCNTQLVVIKVASDNTDKSWNCMAQDYKVSLVAHWDLRSLGPNTSTWAQFVGAKSPVRLYDSKFTLANFMFEMF